MSTQYITTEKVSSYGTDFGTLDPSYNTFLKQNLGSGSNASYTQSYITSSPQIIVTQTTSNKTENNSRPSAYGSQLGSNNLDYVDQILQQSRKSRLEAEKQRSAMKSSVDYTPAELTSGLSFLPPDRGLSTSNYIQTSYTGGLGSQISSFTQPVQYKPEDKRSSSYDIAAKRSIRTESYSNDLPAFKVSYTPITTDRVEIIKKTENVVDLRPSTSSLSIENERLRLELRRLEGRYQTVSSETNFFRDKLRESESKIFDLRNSARSENSTETSINIILLSAEYERLKKVLVEREREVDESKIRGDLSRKSIIDREISDLTARFLSEKDILEREINMKEREIAELRARNYQLSSSTSSQAKPDELRVLRDAVFSRNQEIERLKKSTSSPYRAPPGEAEKIAMISTENERLRMLIREKEQELESLNSKIQNRENESQQIVRENNKLRGMVTKPEKTTGWCC